MCLEGVTGGTHLPFLLAFLTYSPEPFKPSECQKTGKILLKVRRVVCVAGGFQAVGFEPLSSVVQSSAFPDLISEAAASVVNVLQINAQDAVTAWWAESAV